MQTLKGISRTQFGSRPARTLRAEGMVPGIIYGHGEANQPFAVSAHDLNFVLNHGERVVALDLDGSQSNYLIKAVQRDAYDHDVIHVDFTRVDLDETVEVSVRVILRGTPAGEVDGGVMTQGLTELALECTVTNIPEEIRVRVSDMQVGDTLRVKDLPPVDGGRVLTDGDMIVATCKLVTEAPEVAEEAEEPTEPEVIGKREDDQTESKESAES